MNTSLVFFGLTLILLALGQTACVSMSTLQTAETLKKGKTQTTYGGGYYQSPSFDKAVDNTDLKMPYLEFSYREGIAPQFDYGLKLTIIGSAVADVKYQLLDMGEFAAAVGLGVGYLSISTGSGDTQTASRIIDTIVPVYASYKFADNFSLYTAPRYVLRFTSGTNAKTSSLAGGSVGTKIGKNWGVYLEGGYQKEFGGDFSAYQYNASLFFEGDGGLLTSLGI